MASPQRKVANDFDDTLGGGGDAGAVGDAVAAKPVAVAKKDTGEAAAVGDVAKRLQDLDYQLFRFAVKTQPRLEALEARVKDLETAEAKRQATL